MAVWLQLKLLCSIFSKSSSLFGFFKRFSGMSRVGSLKCFGGSGAAGRIAARALEVIWKNRRCHSLWGLALCSIAVVQRALSLCKRIFWLYIWPTVMRISYGCIKPLSLCRSDVQCWSFSSAQTLQLQGSGYNFDIISLLLNYITFKIFLKHRMSCGSPSSLKSANCILKWYRNCKWSLF